MKATFDEVWPGLVPAAGTAHAQWALDQMRERKGVALVVPAGFAAHVRVLHPRADGRRWADVDPRPLGGAGDPDPAYDLMIAGQDTGRLDPEAVDALLPLLVAATGTPERCHFGLWEGWGDLHAGSSGLLAMDERSGLRGQAGRRRSRRAVKQHELDMAQLWRFVAACPAQPWWGGRTMRLFDGPASAVTSMRTWHLFTEDHRRSPQWWWPEDRAWFVGTEIDHPWTYVAGSEALAAAVLDEPRWEAVRVEPAQGW